MPTWNSQQEDNEVAGGEPSGKQAEGIHSPEREVDIHMVAHMVVGVDIPQTVE